MSEHNVRSSQHAFLNNAEEAQNRPSENINVEVAGGAILCNYHHRHKAVEADEGLITQGKQDFCQRPTGWCIGLW